MDAFERGPPGPRTRSSRTVPRPSPEARPPPTCAPVLVVLLLNVALVVGFVIYVIISSRQIADLQSDFKSLKALVVTPSAVRSAPPPRKLDAIAAPPREQFLRFDTPLDEEPVRLPPRPGIMAAQRAGYKIECSFGRTTTQPTADQVSLTFSVDAVTGEEYVTVAAPGPAFRGRHCALTWKG